MTKQLGIIGAGKVGVVLAQLALAAGYTVDIAGSRDAEKIALTIDILAPGANAMTTAEVVSRNNVIILALPLSKFTQLDATIFSDKLILDAMNYWWEVDGHREDFNNPKVGTSELVQAYFNKSIVIKAFNHMGYHDLYDESILITNNEERKAIAMAGDNDVAREKVATIITDLGFTPVILPTLHEGLKLQPGIDTFGANLTALELQKAINTYATNEFGQQVQEAN